MPIQVFTDAQAGLGFAVKQTSHVEAEVYRAQYPDVDYARLIPVDTSANPWSKSVTFYSMDGAGAARWVNANARDVPVVGVNMGQHEEPIYSAAIGYQFGLEELNQAAMLGINIAAENAMVARRVCEEMIYNVALYGDTEKGLEGLFSYSGVPAAAVPSDGTGSSPLWSTKTPDQINRDVNDLIGGVYTSTNTVQMADTLVLPFERYQYIASLRLTDSDTTVLRYIRGNNVYTAMTGQPLQIIAQRSLLTRGAGGTARMIAYRRSPEILKLHLPMPHQFLPVQAVGLGYEVPGIFRLAGLDIRQPKGVRYGDGI